MNEDTVLPKTNLKKIDDSSRLITPLMNPKVAQKKKVNNVVDNLSSDLGSEDESKAAEPEQEAKKVAAEPSPEKGRDSREKEDMSREVQPEPKRLKVSASKPFNFKMYTSDSDDDGELDLLSNCNARRESVHEQYPRSANMEENNSKILKDNVEENLIPVNKPDFDDEKHEQRFVEGDIVYVDDHRLRKGTLMVYLQQFNEFGAYCCTLDRATRMVVEFKNMTPLWSGSIPKTVKEFVIPMFFGHSYEHLLPADHRDVVKYEIGERVYVTDDKDVNYTNIMQVCEFRGLHAGRIQVGVRHLQRAMENAGKCKWYVNRQILPLYDRSVPIEIRDWVEPIIRGVRVDECVTEHSKLHFCKMAHERNNQKEMKRLKTGVCLKGKPRKGDLERHLVPRLGVINPRAGGMSRDSLREEPVTDSDLEQDNIVFVFDKQKPEGNRVLKYMAKGHAAGFGHFQSLDGMRGFEVDFDRLCLPDDNRCPEEVRKFVIPMFQGLKWKDVFADWRCLEIYTEKNEVLP